MPGICRTFLRPFYFWYVKSDSLASIANTSISQTSPGRQQLCSALYRYPQNAVNNTCRLTQRQWYHNSYTQILNTPWSPLAVPIQSQCPLNPIQPILPVPTKNIFQVFTISCNSWLCSFFNLYEIHSKTIFWKGCLMLPSIFLQLQNKTFFFAANLVLIFHVTHIYTSGKSLKYFAILLFDGSFSNFLKSLYTCPLMSYLIAAST